MRGDETLDGEVLREAGRNGCSTLSRKGLQPASATVPSAGPGARRPRPPLRLSSRLLSLGKKGAAAPLPAGTCLLSGGVV